MEKAHGGVRPPCAALGYRQHLTPRKQPLGATQKGSPVEKPRRAWGRGRRLHRGRGARRKTTPAGRDPWGSRPWGGTLGRRFGVPAPRPGRPAAAPAPNRPPSPQRSPTAADRPGPACSLGPKDLNLTGSDDPSSEIQAGGAFRSLWEQDFASRWSAV